MALMRSHFSVLLLFLACTAHALAQEVPVGTKEFSGATYPELIPDDNALVTLYSVIADRPGASTRDNRVGYLKGTGLPREKQETIVDEASRYWVVLTKAQQRLRQMKDEKRSREEIATQRGTGLKEIMKALEESKKTLQTELGQDGYKKLQAFIDSNIKPNMTLVKPD